jgi:competence protein ComEC
VRKDQLFRWVLFGFLAGIAAASFILFSSAFLWLIVVGGALTLLIQRPASIVAGCFLCALAVGAWRGMQAMDHVSVLWDDTGSGSPVTLAGFVDGDFELTDRGGKYPFRVLPANERIIVYGPDWIRPRYGQVLTLTGKLQQPNNTGDFDYRSSLAKSGIYSQIYFPSYGVPTDIRVPVAVRLKRPLIAIRNTVNEAIARAVPQPEAGYLSGIVLGMRSGIGPELADAFSRTGTSHILAVSGYNITIVAGALLAMLAPFGRRRSFWMTIAGIIIFIVMVGASASVVRAGIMGILALTARHVGRQSHAGTALLLAGVVMTAQNPLMLRWDVGFQLSCLAVIGIIYLEPLIRPLLMRIMYEPLAAMTATTLTAQVFVLPVLLYYFGVFAVYTLPVNLLVLPLVPLAMALGLATGVMGLVSHVLASLVGQAAWFIAAVQISIIRYAADLPAAALEISIGWPLMVAAYSGLAAWLISVYRTVSGSFAPKGN